MTFDRLLLGAGLTEERWTLPWDPSQPTEITQLPFLERAAPVAHAEGVHVVLALYSLNARVHPAVPFCSWAAKVAATVQQWKINDLIVWNEANTRLYWSPQKNAKGKDVAAPAYERLLATCYDAIKQANPAAHVIAMGLSPRASTWQSNEPLTFLRDVGAAYRASHRTRPLMDQLALHPYPNPNHPIDSPSVGYRQPSRFGIPNLARVKQAVWDAFHATAQPTTLNGLTFRIDEVGWQVDTAGLPGYVDSENVKTVTPPEQAAYLAQMIEEYFACDPTVTDVMLFLLIDERYRNGRDQSGRIVGGGWQSGLVSWNGTPRPAYGLMAQLATEGRSACAVRTAAWRPLDATATLKRVTTRRR